MYSSNNLQRRTECTQFENTAGRCIRKRPFSELTAYVTCVIIMEGNKEGNQGSTHVGLRLHIPVNISFLTYGYIECHYHSVEAK